jgi:hypothetical protein
MTTRKEALFRLTKQILDTRIYILEKLKERMVAENE